MRNSSIHSQLFKVLIISAIILIIGFNFLYNITFAIESSDGHIDWHKPTYKRVVSVKQEKMVTSIGINTP